MKYMIGAHISQQGGSNKDFVVHETTLLPHIRGFGALMAMIFCKQIDLKRDVTKTRYFTT